MSEIQQHWTAYNQMNKRRRKSNENENECDKITENMDRISGLSDDILLDILSLVDMKTAGRTSLLSTRWRYVWTHSRDLIFEDKQFFIEYTKIDSAEGKRFSNWVCQVMTNHRAPKVNTLRVHFPLWGSNGDKSLEDWVKFALKKNVANLELNLADCFGTRVREMGRLLEVDPTFRHQYCDTIVKSAHLKSLHLEATFVEGPTLEHVLCNCPNIERLTMRACHFFQTKYCRLNLVFRKLVVTSPKLKHLEFWRCSIESLRICAPQLTSFVFIAEHYAKVEYANVSSLVDVTFKVAYCFSIARISNYFSYFSHRLQKLSIFWDKVSIIEWRSTLSQKENLLVLTSLVEACPFLHAFKVEVNQLETEQGATTLGHDGENDNKNNHAMRTHEHLKVVEIVGFDGSASIVELAICLTQHSPSLKKIIFDPRYSSLLGGFSHIRLNKKHAYLLDFARRQAKLLEKRIAVGVEVLIL